jgi:hypothetical protein
MAATYSENKTHRANIAAAEGVRQTGVTSAAGTGAILQANIRAAELTFARTCYASAVANNCGTSQWTTMLNELAKVQS